MKIIFEENGKKRKIILPVKPVLKALLNADQQKDKKENTKRLLHDVVFFLKEYKKKYGSFILLEAEEENASYKIII